MDVILTLTVAAQFLALKANEGVRGEVYGKDSIRGAIQDYFTKDGYEQVYVLYNDTLYLCEPAQDGYSRVEVTDAAMASIVRKQLA